VRARSRVAFRVAIASKSTFTPNLIRKNFVLS
jgi:hypothetical protein